MSNSPWRNRNDDEDDDGDERPRRRRQRSDYDDERHVYDKPDRGGLILALGIMSLMVCAVIGIPAWLMGTADLKAMERGEMDPTGKGLTQAGKIMGIVGTCLFALGMILTVVWLVVILVLVGTK